MSSINQLCAPKSFSFIVKENHPKPTDPLSSLPVDLFQSVAKAFSFTDLIHVMSLNHYHLSIIRNDVFFQQHFDREHLIDIFKEPKSSFYFSYVQLCDGLPAKMKQEVEAANRDRFLRLLVNFPFEFVTLDLSFSTAPCDLYSDVELRKKHLLMKACQTLNKLVLNKMLTPDILQASSSLKEVQLNFKVPHEQLRTLFQQNKASLQKLTFQCPKFKDADVASQQLFFDELAECTQLKKLYIFSIYSLQPNAMNKIAEACLELNDVGLSPPNSPCLRSFYQICGERLTHFYYDSDNDISHFHIFTENCTQITSLNFKATVFTVPFKRYEQIATKCTKITHFISQKCTDLPPEAVLLFKGIVELDISETQITDGALTGLDENLRTLKLDSCPITDAALERIAIHCPNLETLSIQGCKKLTAKGILHLRKCTHLKNLATDKEWNDFNVLL